MRPISLIIFILFLRPAAETRQVSDPAAAAPFVGTWVGTQSWAIDNPSPSAKDEQPVELKIDFIQGQLTGFMTPWFGGSDGATFVQASIADEQLKAIAVVGKPPVPGPRAQRGNWKNSVKIQFNFKNESKDSLTGTADVMMNDVKWLKFNYNLSRKRSRY